MLLKHAQPNACDERRGIDQGQSVLEFICICVRVSLCVCVCVCVCVFKFADVFINVEGCA